ncbi:Coq4-domain-containing protein [Gonapodya prolifera JEL478]|uniref:4-hydroxy-3-methoxy-5-polyprenylbenzoate decarboxylase n=1 Tax=Gonapodya prolifera (strain JEL478) TaxID=1344416 RepID=A0A139ALX6_GONPJ|nr:Coq4-domain-containing protein [Gonapodya prolifera JEL478]|eukprot:KXS17770.1 Coq4-domain-containing protein [Gonapodya prolifera JEL478]
MSQLLSAHRLTGSARKNVSKLKSFHSGRSSPFLLHELANLPEHRQSPDTPLNPYTPKYQSHIPSSSIQKLVIAVGSAFTALAVPTRADMVAALGETTGPYALGRIRDKMMADAVGRRILREKPVVDSATVDLDALRQLPNGTFGREYVRWLDAEGVGPDSREPVKYVDDAVLAYVMQRYRQVHDFWHVVTGMSVSVEAELAVKWWEFAHHGMPVALLSGVFGPLRLTAQQRERLLTVYVPWALRNAGRGKYPMNVYYEEKWEMPLEELRKELGVEAVPAL